MQIRIINLALLFAIYSIGILNGYCQGTFRNLNFDDPVVPLIQDSEYKVATSNAIPGWEAYIDNKRITRMYYNTVSIGTAAISLHGPDSSYQACDGDYSVILQVSVPEGRHDASIAQHGQIPISAKSLIFHAYNVNIAVTFEGQDLNVMDLGVTENNRKYRKYGVNIEKYTGETGELSFTAINSSGSLDCIKFSAQLIPEPVSCNLILFGAAIYVCKLAFWYRKRCILL
ncbi:MAG: hypothetical protein K9N48_01330 [Verrucomicrobia bacterium]|nr:hypothetical protein [Verrucomicrobiota bacterium]MCF7707294.1 hypothetical protein [Verrucomicrobiota bacterium]